MKRWQIILLVVSVLNVELAMAHETPFGYQFLNGGKVFNMWNPHLDYYFNTSSGLQFTNNYNVYWTKNIFCIGYKDILSGDWFDSCNDGSILKTFSWNIETDNLTYVSAQGYKNITFANKNVEVGLNYTLNTEQDDLIIRPSLKNIDSTPIREEIRFIWKTKDIAVGGSQYNNFGQGNGTEINLSRNWDIIGKVYPYEFLVYRQDTGFWFRTRWDYPQHFLQVKSEVGQFNAPITLYLNTTRLNVGQKKETNLYWIDATCGGSFLEPTPISNQKLHDEERTQTLRACIQQFSCPVSIQCEEYIRIQRRTEGAAGWTLIAQAIQPVPDCAVSGEYLQTQYTFLHNNLTDLRTGYFRDIPGEFGCTPVATPIGPEQRDDIWLNNHTPTSSNVSLNITLPNNKKEWKVQSGYSYIDSGLGNVTVNLPEEIDVDKSFLLMDITSNITNNIASRFSMNGFIENSTTIRFQRREPSVAGYFVNISYYVIEGPISVQSGEVTINTESKSVTDTLSNPVNLNKSIIVHNARSNFAVATQFDKFMVKNNFIDSSTINFSIYNTILFGGDTTVVSYYVVEFEDANIVNGTTQFTGSQTQVNSTLSRDVNISKSWLYFTYDSELNGLSPVSIRGNLINGSIAQFNKNLTNGANNISYYVVEFTDDTTVSRGNQVSSTGDTTENVAITISNISKSFSFTTDDSQGTGTAFPRPFFTEQISSTTNLVLNRFYSGQVSQHEWQVINLNNTNIEGRAICYYDYNDLDGDAQNVTNPPPYYEWYEWASVPLPQFSNQNMINVTQDNNYVCCVKPQDVVFETGAEQYSCSGNLIVKPNVVEEAPIVSIVAVMAIAFFMIVRKKYVKEE